MPTSTETQAIIQQLADGIEATVAIHPLPWRVGETHECMSTVWDANWKLVCRIQTGWCEGAENLAALICKAASERAAPVVQPTPTIPVVVCEGLPPGAWLTVGENGVVFRGRLFSWEELRRLKGERGDGP